MNGIRDYDGSARSRLFALAVLLALPLVANGGPLVDCPLRDAPYSVDSPLIDVLLKPEARTSVERAAPNLLKALPSGLQATTSPSFAAIVSLRGVARLTGTPDDSIGRLDAELKSLEITTADREARCARYDVTRPDLQLPRGKPRLLLFEKITGFRDGPSVDAAHAAFVEIARRNGWALVATDRAGAMTPDILKRFDAVIWNNVSGDVLTIAQRQAFQSYVEGGGGFVGVHGSAGDPVSFWDWYVDSLIGARFAGHPSNPQFQEARVVLERTASGIGRGLPASWTMQDEWYSFKNNPRQGGAKVIATLDETTYAPGMWADRDLRMGDHPIAWTRCVTSGRSFYSAIGHRPETYALPEHLTLLEQGIRWAAGVGLTRCRDGEELPR